MILNVYYIYIYNLHVNSTSYPFYISLKLNENIDKKIEKLEKLFSLYQQHSSTSCDPTLHYTQS